MDTINKILASLKKVWFFAFKSLAFGLAVGLVWVGFYLYTNRPQSWNSNAITATFDRIGTNITGHMTFAYVLKNNTDKDYSLSTYDYKIYTSRLDGSLAQSDEVVTFETPLFIPARQSLYVNFTFAMPYDQTSPDMKASLEEWRAYRQKESSFLAQTYPNLDGFLLLDTTSHFKITLPAGWKTLSTP